MTDRRRIEGYDCLIQCNEISSSSDILNYVSSLSYIPTVRGRRTYRAFRPEHLIPMPLLENNNPPPLVHSEESSETISTTKSLMCLGILFSFSIFALALVYTSFPKVTDEEREHIKLPMSREDAQKLGLVLNRYKDDNFVQVLVGVFTVYIFLQTFAIPGSLFLSILSGYLFSFFTALVLVCTCSAIGASLCFLVSQLVGKRIVMVRYPDRVKKWAKTINNQRDNLFYYMVFLRATPFLPNWFINLTAPVVGVPLKPFVLGTFVGVAPMSFIAIQAGQTLQSATDSGVSWTSIALLSIFALISLLPVFLKQRLKEKFE